MTGYFIVRHTSQFKAGDLISAMQIVSDLTNEFDRTLLSQDIMEMEPIPDYVHNPQANGSFFSDRADMPLTVV